ncbi:hypothetical protein O1V64_11875 [Rouxiella badensis]|uniref:Uncharacterized protein n=1 Tax=Rouxiella badensis TaxID=1646377 RepID=A0A1X0WHD8_9GAMM|nr:hypothetical protein [Rouxiella badensis]ORJ26205.1 hypothetical protein BS640_07695 [Rouxiella badensis]WAT06597.1 hypothetical protein O1V64_11875 [Rouxiella badensis]
MMRKGYPVKTYCKGNSNYSRLSPEESEITKPFNTHDGRMSFAYKGLVIDKRNSLYSVRDVKLEGFPVHLVEGVFNDSRMLRIAIDGGLLTASPEKLERLRERNKNVSCGGCGTPFLFRRNMLIDYLGGKIIQCPYCYFEEFEDRLNWGTDESFY